MNGNFGASNTIIHEAGVTVQSLNENLKMDAVLSESLSDGKTNKKWKKRMKREDKKATNIDEVPSIDKPKIEEGSIQNLACGNETEIRNKKLKSKKAKVKDDVQSSDQTNMDTTPTKDLAEGDVAIEDPIVKDELQSVDQTRMDTRSTKILAEVQVTRKRKKKRKCDATINDEVQWEVDTGSTENLAEGNVTIKNPKSREDAQSIGQANMDIIGSRESLDEGNVIIKNPKVQDDVQRIDQTEMDTGPTENSAEVHVSGKHRKKRKREAKISVEVQREVDTGSIENLAEGNGTIEKPKNREDVQSIGQANMDIIGSRENLDEGNVIIKNPKVQDDVQRIDQTEMDTGPTENSAEVHVSGKHKKKRKSKAKISVEVQREVDTGSIENLAEGNGTIEKPKNSEDVQSIGQTNMVVRLTENLAEGNVIIKDPKIQDDVQCVDQSEMDTGPTENSAEAHMTSKRKKKRKSKIKINDEVQREVNTGSIGNLAEGSVTIVKPNIREDVQNIGQTNLYTGSKENFAERNVMIIKNPKIQDDVQSMDQTEMDTGPTGSSAEGIVTGKRKKKRKGRVKINDEAQSNIDNSSTENLAQGNAVNEIPKIKDEVQSTGMDKMDAGSKDTWSTENLAEGNVIIKNLKIQDEAHSMDQNKMDTWQTEKSTKGNVSGKRKEKRKIKDEVQSDINTRPMENLDEGYLTTEKPKTTMDAWSTENLAEGNMTIENLKIQDEAQSMDQAKVETGPAENSAEGKIGKRKKKQKRKRQTNYEVESVVDTRPTEKLPEGNVTIDNPNIQDEVQSMDQTKMEAGPTENSAKGIVSGKRKRQRKSKAETKDEVLSVVDTRTTENLDVGNVTTKKPKINDEVQNTELSKMDTMSTENLAEGNEAYSRDQTEMDTWPTENSAEVNVTRNRKKKEKIKAEASRKMDTGSTENLPEGKVYAEGTSAISTSDVKDAKDMCPSPITPVRRKLLVLDVNGLLADIVYSAPNHCKGDIKIFGRAVFKRPFCDDFLKFCFQNFDVGIWSSRSKKIIEPVVNFLLGDQKDKLLFCWDMDHATKTRFNTLENKHKPLVCKELSKIWENDDCNLPWKKEDYDESNTLLLDDSPYKALLNPLHTAIFPSPYQYDNENDDSLGPGGNLRVYLEGLVTAENVQKYVEQHPFGQRPITEEHCSWEFYSRVLHQVSKAVKGKTSMPNSVDGINSIPNPVDGITLMPSPEEGKTSLPSPFEGRTSMPIPEEGITSMLNPEEGKILISNPVEGKSLMPKSVKGRDVKWVEARQTSPFKPKKKKARATFLWPI